MAGVVRLDKINSVYTGHIESVKPLDATLVVENGSVGKAGSYFDGERELRKLEVAGAGDSLVLIANAEIPYEENQSTANNLQLFAQEAGKASRGYTLKQYDVFSVSDDMVDAIGTAPVKGNFVVASGVDFKLKEVTEAELTGTEKFVGKIAAKEQLGSSRFVTGQAGVLTSFVPLTVIDVLSN